ncbi:Chromosome transmission fidelity protein 18 [Chlorella vulgaris]
MDFDDLDCLLDLEESLHDDCHKRSHADLRSQQDAARFLPDAPGSKRPRVDGSNGGQPSQPPAADELTYEELLALAESEPQEPSQTANTFQALSATEEQQLLAIAADTQPSHAAAGGGRGYSRVPAHTASTFRALGETEQQQLLALAHDSQPSQSAAEDGRVPRASMVGSRTACQPGEGQDDDELDMAGLDEMLAAEKQGLADPAGGGGASQPGPSQAAEFVLPRRPYVPPAKEVYRIQGASMTVTGEGGERVYCQLEPAEGAAGGRKSRQDLASMLRRSRGGLLSQSITSLLAAVEKRQYELAVAESAAATAAAAAAAAATAGGSTSSAAAAAQQQPQQQQEPTVDGQQQHGCGSGAAGQRGSSLWVDKYAPAGYIDLLSDEQINREVVRWLKGWDSCVFGTAAAPQQAAGFGAGTGSRYQKHGGFGGQQQQRQQQPGGGGLGGGAADALGRPEQRVILIAGPPGLGKTTLAHVCAVHCGYRPVEINASDDRSGASLQGKVLDAVQMQSVLGERRPNCVIIDEIDGATGGAEGRSGIAALIKIVNAKPGKQAGGGAAAADKSLQEGGGEGAEDLSDSDAEDGEGQQAGAATSGAEQQARRGDALALGRRLGGGSGGGGGRARQQQLQPLLRPIISICNDLYAPALRPLRDVARVFVFRKPQAERLAQRLQVICAAEGLRCEKSTLRLLVERTECDIRSCLNTLQFLSRQRSVVRLADLSGLSIGQKDMTKGAFAKSPAVIGKLAESEAQRVGRLYDGLQDFGEHELVMGGLQENVLSLRYFDMALQRTCAVLDHLSDADRFMRCCFRGGEFGLLKYVPAPLVLVSSIVAGPDRPQLQWPRSGFNATRRMAANAALLQGWMLGMSPATCAATSKRSMLLEVLPALMHIAAPALRPVSQHLYSSCEQEAVRSLVDTLLNYNLRYCLDSSAEEAEEAAAAAQQQRQQHGSNAAEGRQQPAARSSFAEPPLRFRPAVHRTCRFMGQEGTGKLLPAAVRQTISHEADMEAIRRAEATRRSSGNGGGAASPPQAAAATALAGSGSCAAPAQHRPSVVSGPVPLTLAERMKAAGTAANVVRRAAAAASKGTWLDKLKEQHQSRAAAVGREGNEGGRRHKFAVLYRFHEGYTNAVKRPVTMQDLLR